ncbi:MAG: hypothetical protein AB7O62_26145 [Pirellulales bacterium]
MSKPGALVFGVLVGAAAVYGALNFHILQTDAGVQFVRKSESNFKDTYVDTRQFGVGDWIDHPQLAEDLVRAGKQDIMSDAAAESLEQGFSRAFGTNRR